MDIDLKKLTFLNRLVGIVMILSAIIFCFMADYISSQARLGIKFSSFGIYFFLIPIAFIVLGFFIYKGQRWAERLGIVLFTLIVLFLLYFAIIFIVLIIIPIAAILLIIIPLGIIIIKKVQLEKVTKILKKKIISKNSSFLKNFANF